MPALWLVAAVVVASVVVLLYQGIALVLALQMPKLPVPPPPRSGRYPTVSVIVAARNEEQDLPGCLDGLLAQDYPSLEILVVDGGSTDATRQVARSRGPRVQVIEEPPLPDGWVGKNLACDVGFRASHGELLLFTDADVRYDPSAVRATVEWMEREGAALATLAPRIETVGFWERLILPFYTQMVLTYFRTPRVNLDTSRTAMANGQFLVVRREAYEKTGGHAAIRGAVLEDVRLAQEFRRAGYRLRVAWAPDLLSTRMYQDRKELFEGILKNVHGTKFSSARQFAFLAGLVGFFWLPFGVLPIGLLWGSLPVSVLGAFLLFALFAKHVAFTSAIRVPAGYGLLFPLAVGFYVTVVSTSIVRGVRRRPIVWKGREYALDGSAGDGRSSPAANR